MGTDIHGWVELLDPLTEEWEATIDIEWLVGRNYDMFGQLFGVRGYTGFAPIAERRGLPADVSRDIAKERDDPDWHSFTHIAQREIAAIDWGEESPELDERVHQYVRQGGGLQAVSKFAWSSQLSDAEYERMGAGEAVEKGGFVYRRERVKRGDGLCDDWRLLFDLMKRCAEDYGPDSVRLVVWFDN